MAAPRSITAHVLNPMKGWPSQTALDFHAPLASTVLDTVDPVFSGRVAHLNASGEYELGVPNGQGSGKVHMPIFLFPNSDDPDVSNDGGISGTADDDPEGWAAVKRNNMLGLVAMGGYELETTEFNTTQSYEPGDALQAATGDNGVVKKGTPYTHMIVGTVSRGVKYLGQLPNRQTLAFWPIVIQPTA
jgi:hypothetical protein